jgi:AGCS family alanine or glycine:cation symporter
VWNFSDMMNGLMALPNLIGLLLLSGMIARETRWYLKHDLTLDATKEGIELFMKDRPDWADWKDGDVLGSSRMSITERTAAGDRS